MNRRALLGSLGALGAFGFAGCLDGVPFTRATTTLGSVSLSNFDTREGHRFDVRVERDGALVHESSHQLDSASRKRGEILAPSAVTDCTWDGLAGRYVLSVRTGSDEWTTFDTLEHTDGTPDCVVASVWYGTPEGVRERNPYWLTVVPFCDSDSGQGSACSAGSSVGPRA